MTTPAEEPTEDPTEDPTNRRPVSWGHVRIHPVDTRRRGLQAIGFTILGGLLVAGGIPAAAAYVADADASGYSILPGALLGLGLTLLGLGVLRVGQSIARPDERFELYERGFLQHTRRRNRTVPWSDILGLRRVGQDRGSGISHALGLGLRCVVFTRSDGRIAFNTFTEDADHLARVIYEQAAPRTASGEHRTDVTPSPRA